MKYKIKQIIPDGQFTDENKWYGSAGGAVSKMQFVGKTADGYAHYSKLATTSKWNHIIRPINPVVTTVDTNKYLMILKGYSNISQTVSIADHVTIKQTLGSFVANTPKTLASIFSFTTSSSLSTRYTSITDAYDIYLKELQTIDLTATFGEGNEPTTPEEFANRLGFSSIDDVPYFEFGETDFNVGYSIYQITDTSARRRMMMASYKSILPAEYQRVEYLESDGNQWIDTGVLPLGKKVEMKFLVTDNTNTTGLFGSRQSQTSASARSHNLFVHNKEIRIDYTWDSGFNNFDFILNEDITCVINEDGSVMFNNTLFEQRRKRTSCSYTIYLFNFNNAGTPYTKGTPQRLYYCKIADERYFIPCYRKVDKVVGMYDVIEGIFYTNAGTGTFTVGRNIKG